MRLLPAFAAFLVLNPLIAAEGEPAPEQIPPVDTPAEAPVEEAAGMDEGGGLPMEEDLSLPPAVAAVLTIDALPPHERADAEAEAAELIAGDALASEMLRIDRAWAALPAVPTAEQTAALNKEFSTIAARDIADDLPWWAVQRLARADALTGGTHRCYHRLGLAATRVRTRQEGDEPFDALARDALRMLHMSQDHHTLFLNPTRKIPAGALPYRVLVQALEQERAEPESRHWLEKVVVTALAAAEPDCRLAPWDSRLDTLRKHIVDDKDPPADAGEALLAPIRAMAKPWRVLALAALEAAKQHGHSLTTWKKVRDVLHAEREAYIQSAIRNAATKGTGVALTGKWPFDGLMYDLPSELAKTLAMAQAEVLRQQLAEDAWSDLAASAQACLALGAGITGTRSLIAPIISINPDAAYYLRHDFEARTIIAGLTAAGQDRPADLARWQAVFAGWQPYLIDPDSEPAEISEHSIPNRLSLRGSYFWQHSVARGYVLRLRAMAGQHQLVIAEVSRPASTLAAEAAGDALLLCGRLDLVDQEIARRCIVHGRSPDAALLDRVVLARILRGHPPTADIGLLAAHAGPHLRWWLRVRQAGLTSARPAAQDLNGPFWDLVRGTTDWESAREAVRSLEEGPCFTNLFWLAVHAAEEGRADAARELLGDLRSNLAGRHIVGLDTASFIVAAHTAGLPVPGTAEAVPPQEHPSLGTDQQFAVLRTWVKDPGAIVVVNPERLELEALLAQQNPRHPQVILATSFDKRDNPVEQVRKLVRRLRINGAIDDGLDRNIVSWCDRLDLHALTGGGQRVGDLLGQATIEAISADPSRVAPPVGALPAVFFQFFSEQDSAVARLVQVLALRTAAIHRIIARANPGDATLIRLWEALLNTTASYRLECARRLLDANLDEMWSEQTAKILAGSMRGPDRIVAHQHLLACHLAGRDWPTIAAALDKALRDGIAISLGDGIDDLPWGTLQRERLPLTEAVENLTSAFVERRDHPTTPLDDAAAGRLVSTLVGCRNALSFDRDAFPVMTSIEADGVTRAEFATQVGDGRLNGSHWPLLLVGKGSLSERGEYLQKAAVLTVFSAQARTLPELRKWFRHAPTNEKDWLELHGAMASGDAAAAEKLLRSLAPQGKPVTSSMVDQYQWEAPIRRWLNLFAWLAGREARKPIPYPALPPGRDPGRAQAAECMAKVVTAVNERRFADAQQLVTGFLDTLTGTQLLHSHDALDLLFLARSGVIIQRAAQDAREAQRRKLEEQRAEDTKNDKKPGKKK